MKVIQVNAWVGHLMYPLLELLEKEDPDIVCLQEATSNAKGFSLFHSFSLLQQLQQRFPHHFFSPTFTFPVFDRRVGYGNLIVSKYPLDNQRTVFINKEYVDAVSTDGFDYNIRNAQFCTVDVDGTQVTIVNHHGFHDTNPAGTDKSLECIEKLITEVKSIEGRLIMCGDFNVGPSSKVIRTIGEQLSLNNLTIDYGIKTTLSPIFRVKDIEVAADYIFTSTDIQIMSFAASDDIVSDHKALILEVNL